MSKQATGETLPLDIRAIARCGYLIPAGAAFSWKWTTGATIRCRSNDREVVLTYNWNKEPVNQCAAIEWTRCNYGGRRAWWNCPNCRRRVAVLYCASKYFACRHCYQLCYFSQQERESDRLLRRAWKIRQRLGQVGGGHLQRMVDKPKGMHWHTYFNLMRECNDCEYESLFMAARACGIRIP